MLEYQKMIRTLDIAELSDSVAGHTATPEAPLPPSCLIEDERDIAVFYAPFDWINGEAKIVLLGLTPGLHQAQQAWFTYRAAKAQGFSDIEASKAAKETASFAGRIRINLINMLNGIGLADALGINDCEHLFNSQKHLVHNTSALRHPAFQLEKHTSSLKNYGGNPPPLRYKIFRSYVDQVLAPELESLPSSLIIPLGSAVNKCTDHLVSIGMIDRNRVLAGFPHPSGGNGHRVRQYNERRLGLQAKVQSALA